METKDFVLGYGAGKNSAVSEKIVEEVDTWLDEHITNPDSPPLDRSLTSSSAAAPADIVGDINDEVGELRNTLSAIVGDVLLDGSHSYTGVGNWFTIPAESGTSVAIKIYTNSAGVEFDVGLCINDHWSTVKTIKDVKWHIIDIPANTTEDIAITYRGSSAITISAIFVEVDSNKNIEGDIVNIEEDIAAIEEDIAAIEDDIATLAITEQSYGNNGETSTSYAFNSNFTACPCKKANKAGKITSIYVKNYSSGTVDIYIGKVDQLYLFVPRMSFSLNVDADEKIYDISSRNIFINEEEQLLIKFSGGKTAFDYITGEPEGDNSFYYSSNGGMQLQVYGAQYAARFGFGYTIESSIINSQEAQITYNEKNIETLTENVSTLQANFNVVSDRQGNKYRMVVRNGAIALLAMNFNHVLCVGNSYTIHPTIEDTEPDYANNLWWGHWAMAASAKAMAWASLLETALKQKVNNAKVTPIFGRRYETNPATYTLNNPNTFTYWDGTAWQSLSNNLASFNDVDGIVFFLGANYSGNDWYSLYSAMIEKFLTWFPNAMIYCCSCSYFSMQAKDEAIQQVANEELGTYISMVGINGFAKLGAYVYGDDNNLYQIDNSAVAGHFGDYGEYLILDRICSAMGYENNSALYNIGISPVSGVTFTVESTKTVSGAVVSVFADVASGTTLSSITVTDASNNSVSVTDHGVTTYGRIFTFVMPSSDVTITGNVS